MLHKIRELAVVGLSVAALAACSANSDDTSSPAWVGATQSLAPSASSPPPPAAAQAVTKPEILYTFPVVGKSSYARTHHDYPATDVMTACGNRFVAVTSGVVLAVLRKDTWTAKLNAGATRGGRSVSILGDDGVRYYGSHLSAVDAAIKPGVRVTSGQTLGKTGESGDASACHLHFGISPPCAKEGDWWNQRGVLWPWPYLDSWRKGGQKSAVAEVTAWHAKNGCPTKPGVDP